MTYLDDDASIERSKPIELYTFTSKRLVSPVVARSTSYQRDVVFGGNTFTATPIRRSDSAMLAVDSSTPEMQIEVHALHPAVIFYRRGKIAPQGFRVLIQRLQGAAVEEVFEGYVSEAKQNGRTVSLTVTQQLDEPLATKFPSIQVSTLCQHQLFDTLCTASRAANQVITTLATMGDGRTVTVASVGAFTAEAFGFGELLHAASGERRMVAIGTSPTTLQLDVRLPSTAIAGDAVTIWRGCNRSIDHCRTKFSNVANFGGNPHIATKRFLWNFPGLLKQGKTT